MTRTQVDFIITHVNKKMEARAMDPYENKNNENREMNEDENSSRSSSWYRDEQKLSLIHI